MDKFEVYNGHEILCSCKADSQEFTATATIMWTMAGGTTISLFLRSPERRATAEAAVVAVLQLAKAWIDTFLAI
jgi:hypothetical protein